VSPRSASEVCLDVGYGSLAAFRPAPPDRIVGIDMGMPNGFRWQTVTPPKREDLFGNSFTLLRLKRK